MSLTMISSNDCQLCNYHTVVTLIGDFPSVMCASFSNQLAEAPLKVNIQFKVNKVKIQFLDV